MTTSIRSAITIWILVPMVLSIVNASGALATPRRHPKRLVMLLVLEAGSLKEARDIKAKLKRGEALKDLAERYAAAELREQLGYQGVVEEGTLDESIRREISKLKAGETSQPISEPGGGYLIVRLLKPPEAAALKAPIGTGNYYLELGLVFGELGDQDGEIVAYQKAIELDSDLQEAYINLGESLRRKAVELLRGAGKTSKQSTRRIEEALNLLDDAIDYFKIALRINPESPEAHYDLGLAYAAEGLLGLALLEFQEALRLRPEDPEIHKSTASVFLLEKDCRLARDHARRAQELGGDVKELTSMIEKGCDRNR